MEQMLTDLFLFLLNMSISAGWLILATVVLRFVFRKAPRWIHCFLWGIAGLRLVLPFSVESIFSLVPSKETVPPEIIYEASPQIHSGIPALNSVVNPIIESTFAPDPASSANPLQIIIIVASYLWAVGMAALIIYMLVSYFALRYKMSTATKMQDNIFESEKVGSPFVLGIFRPKIYLPYGISDSDREYVIAHEKAHVRRKDHLIKPLAYLVLCVYWFNPLVWLAYVLLCRDIEMACDEKVIREMKEDCRKDYSEALLSCSVNRRKIAACPLAFGEVGVKERIKGVMNYKKPALWLIIVAAVSCVVTAMCFLTDPVGDVQLFGAVYDKGTAVYTHMDASYLSSVEYYEISEKGDLWQIKDNGELSLSGVLVESDMTKSEFYGYIPEEKQKDVKTGRIKKAYELNNDEAQKDATTLFFVTDDGKIYQATVIKTGSEEVLLALLLHEKTENESFVGISDYSAVIDTVTADIDSDGKKENCVLTYGPTSGLYTIVFTATEVGSDKPEYINTFNMTHSGSTRFFENTDGKVQIQCENSVYQKGESVKTKDIFLDIKIEDSNIALYNGDEKVAYWGEQGITPSEFFKKLTALENAVGEAVLTENNGAYVIKEGKEEYKNAKAFEAHNILYSVKDDEKKTLTVYVQTLYKEYDLQNGEISVLASGAVPVEITFNAKEDNGEYEYILKKYRALGKSDDIENYLPEDYEYNTAEIMDGLEFEIERQKNVHYGYLDSNFSSRHIVSDNNEQLTFIEVSNEYLQDMINDVVSQDDFTEFNYEINSLRRVFHNGEFYYYCGYKNEKDKVFVFFKGFNLESVCVIDFNKTVEGSEKCAVVCSGEEYSVCEKLIRETDKIS